jgi:hypothetical protein
MQPRLKVEPLAEEIVRLIVDKQEGDRLRWREGGSVKVLVGEVIPADSTGEQYQQLLKDGLPTIRFEDGTVRHPDVAVDEWLRRRYAADPDMTCIGIDLKRIADHFDPPPSDKVGSHYVARRLGCTTTWVADMVRRGEIPSSESAP